MLSLLHEKFREEERELCPFVDLLKAKRAMGRNHAVNDEKDVPGQSEVCRE
jgi:hypothetical protein